MCCTPRPPDMPWFFTYASTIASLHTRQRNVAPRPTLGAGAGPFGPVPISNLTAAPGWQSTGFSQVSAPFRFDNQKDDASGAMARQAGFGHCTVRAHSHATTAPPPGAEG